VDESKHLQMTHENYRAPRGPFGSRTIASWVKGRCTQRMPRLWFDKSAAQRFSFSNGCSSLRPRRHDDHNRGFEEPSSGVRDPGQECWTAWWAIRALASQLVDAIYDVRTAKLLARARDQAAALRRDRQHSSLSRLDEAAAKGRHE